MIKGIEEASEIDDEIGKADNKVIILYFSADWCHHCRRVYPYVEKFMQNFNNLILLKVDADIIMAASIKYKVSYLPTFVAIVNGRVEETIVMSDEDQIKRWLARYNKGKGKWNRFCRLC